MMLTSCTPEVRILYTASLNGNLTGCDCWGYPEAGLDKRAYWFAGHPKSAGDILLDAGNILEEGRQQVLADLILETYRELGYDAVAVGLNELAEGPDVLAGRAADRPGRPEPMLLSHNLVLDGRPLASEPLYLNAGEDQGTPVAVVSLADPDWFEPYRHLLGGRLTIADPLTVLSETVGQAGDRGASALVLLAHGRESWIREFMDEASGVLAEGPPVAAVVLAGEEKLIEDRLAGGIPLVSPGEEGNRLGVLEVRPGRRTRWRNEFIEFHYLGPSDPRVARRGDEYQTWLDTRRSE